VIVCPLGIDTEMFRVLKKYKIPPRLQSLDIAPGDKVVFFAGRLIEMKGIRYLLEAEKIYNKKKDIRTIVAGGGQLKDMVMETAKNNNAVNYLGFVENDKMPDYYNFIGKHNAVLCVPSSSEGMSLVYLEAMNCGLPVVACCKTDMGELDFMKKNALFAKFGVPADIAEKINYVLNHTPRSRDEISRTVRKYNITNFFNSICKAYDVALERYK